MLLKIVNSFKLSTKRHRSIFVTGLLTFCKDVVDGPLECHAIDTSSEDQSKFPHEELNQSTSEVNKTSTTDIVKSHGESTALNNTTDDLQEKKESDISSLANDSKSKFIHDNATDSSSTFQACSGENEEKVSDKDLKTDREVEVEQHHNCEKKTDLAMPKTDASQIIADVVESIEQESTPPVAPPRRRKRKKKAEGESQVSSRMVTGQSSPYCWVLS